jgi:hypothetical protein
MYPEKLDFDILDESSLNSPDIVPSFGKLFRFGHLV